MKKILLCLLMSLSLVACSNTSTEPTTTATPDETTTTEETTTLKIGLGSVTGIDNKSAATEDSNGESVITTTICVVTLDGDMINQVTFNTVEAKAYIDSNGAMATDFDAEILSKKELGDDYNMVTYGNSIGEWYEEVADLEMFLTGKTVEEALALETSEDMMTELNTTTTISITDFIKALDKAIVNAVEVENLDSFGLGLVSNFSSAHSSDASEDGDGALEANITYAAVGYDVDGKIVSLKLDVAQNKTYFDTTGTFTTDTMGENPTKVEKGDDCGMVAYGNSIAELYEEVAGLEAFLIGKTVEEVLLVEGDADMMTELNTTTTITISGYIKAINNSTTDVKSVK